MITPQMTLLVDVNQVLKVFVRRGYVLSIVCKRINMFRSDLLAHE